MSERFEVRVETGFRARHRRDAHGRSVPEHEHAWQVAVHARSRILDPIALVVDFRILREETDRVLAELTGSSLEEHPELGRGPVTSIAVGRWLLARLAGLGAGKPWEVHAVEVECDPGVRYVISAPGPAG